MYYDDYHEQCLVCKVLTKTARSIEDSSSAMTLPHLPDVILFFSFSFYFSLVKTLSLPSMNASLDENFDTVCNFHIQFASRDCNFSHSQLCQTALFHFSLTLVTQLRYYLYKSVLLLSSSTLLFRYERINFPQSQR